MSQLESQLQRLEEIVKALNNNLPLDQLLSL